MSGSIESSDPGLDDLRTVAALAVLLLPLALGQDRRGDLRYMLATTGVQRPSKRG